MTRTEVVNVLQLRRDLTGESFNDGTIDAWRAALDGWPVPQVHDALTVAARAHQRVAVAHVVAELPPRPATTDTGHPINCVCGGQGLLSEMVPDRLRPGQLYQVWRPCPGNERRAVDNPGAEISLDDYLQRVQRRADNGDVEAQHELKAWKRHPANPAQQQPGTGTA